MAEIPGIINYKIQQNEILSRIVAQNYVGADGKAIDLKTQQGKLLSAKLSEALIGQGDNKKVVIPNAKVPHSNHIMAGADLSLVEKLDLGDGLTFVRSDLANKGKVTVAPEPEAKPAPTPAVEAVPVDTASASVEPVAESTCPDTEVPAKTAPVIADNPFSLGNIAQKSDVPPEVVASPVPETVVPAEPVSIPDRDGTFVDSNIGEKNIKEATHLVADRPVPEVPTPAPEVKPAPIQEAVAPKTEEPSKETSAHPLTYTPNSFKASLVGGDKKPEDIDIPQLGEPEKPELPKGIVSFLAEQNFAEHEGEVSPSAIPKGIKADSNRVAIDF